MKYLASAFMWGGLALFLFPIALICLGGMIMIGIANPYIGGAFALAIFAIGRELLASKGTRR